MASNPKTLLPYQDIPKWLQSNRYLLSGYRFHVFDSHSPSVSSFFHHLDHLGIVILMWGAGISMIYYGFPCDTRLRTTYWALMSCAAGSCAAVTLLPKFRIPQYHCWKIATYTSLGLTGLVFITHGLVMFGWETQNRRLPLLWVAGMAVINLVGALIFAARIPEQWFPHKFDILGCSHQIFHIAVMVAACLHFATLVKASTSHAERDLC